MHSMPPEPRELGKIAHCDDRALRAAHRRVPGRHARSRRQPEHCLAIDDCRRAAAAEPVQQNPHRGVLRKKKPIMLDVASHSAYGPWRLVTLSSCEYLLARA